MRQQFSFQDVTDAIGKEAASLLVAGFGGTSLDIPESIGRTDLFEVVATQIGHISARKLFIYCPGVSLYVPMQTRDLRLTTYAIIAERFDAITQNGTPARKAVKRIAREVYRSERTVWRALKRTV